MAKAAKERPPEFRVPAKAEDQVRFGRVGIIAAVGFVIGVAWPALAGKSLAPTAPGSSEGTGGPVASAAKPAASAAPPAAKAQPAETAAPEPVNAQLVRVGAPKVTSCRNSKGQRLRECDDIDFDESAKARIATLANCEGAHGASGTLSLGFELDFRANKIKSVLQGQSTTLSDDVAKKILDCAKKEFASASISGIEHRHASYTIYYPAKFIPPGEPVEDADAGAPKDTPASGLATVSWDVALVRDAPKEGAIVARVLHGTRVAVKARRDDWYKISYDAKGSEGWVYRGAIGL